MRNWYDRKYIVLCAPIAERRGRTFERKLIATEERGYKMVGRPRFFQNGDKIIGVVLMLKS
jgi:hypothetical protein